jgi:hypothetical protein
MGTFSYAEKYSTRSHDCKNAFNKKNVAGKVFPAYCFNKKIALIQFCRISLHTA